MTYKASKDELKVIGLLGYGKDTTKNTKYLSSMTGFSERRVRGIIQRLRKNLNVPIVGVRTGSKLGYYIATNEEERREAIQPIASEIKELTALKYVLETALIRFDWYKHLKGGKDDGRA